MLESRPSPRFARLTVCVAAFIPALSLAAGTAAAASAGPTVEKARPVKGVSHNYDIRMMGRDDLAEVLKEYAGPGTSAGAESWTGARGRAIAAQAAILRETAPGARVSPATMTGGIETVGVPRGFLTGPAPSKRPAEVVLGFLREHAALYGLSSRDLDDLLILGESAGGRSGLRVVRIEQTVHGRPVFQSETRGVVDREGRLVRTVGRLVPGIDEARVAVAGFLPAEEALRAALEPVGIQLEPDRVRGHRTASSDDEQALALDDAGVTGPVAARLVYFPLGQGVLAPAWSFVVLTPGAGDWYTLVDARRGIVLYRKNIEQEATTQEARFGVYALASGQPTDSPSPNSPNALPPGTTSQPSAIARSTIGMLAVQNALVSPNGWIPDGGTTTTGNNVDAFLDRNNDGVGDPGTLDGSGRPIGNPDAFGRNRDFVGTTPRDFEYTPAPLGANPDAGDAPTLADLQRGVVTNLFFLTNYYHDRLYELGFDEGAANFQTNNFGLGGVPNDAVTARAQAGAGTGSANNATFSTPPDGNPGAMRMFLWTPATPDRDGGLDAEIVLHELTHGLTGRMLGNAAGLNWQQGGGMGEGWSDFFALSLLANSAGDVPDSQYPFGGYATYRLGGMTSNYLYGIRRFPYSTVNTVNPLTWADADDTTDSMTGGISPSPLGFQNGGASEVHNTGEIWALSLWEARSRVIAANGGNVALGNQIMLQIVFDALALTPIDPSFVEARDALFDADCAANACANELSIWEGFADRGLGYYATTSSGYGTRLGVKESFQVPPLDAVGHAIDDTTGGDGNGRIEPGETVRITISLANPWRGASRAATGVTATLSSPTPGVSIFDNTAAYPDLSPTSTASGDPFEFSLDGMAACGQSVALDVTTTSSLGVHVTRLNLRAGTPTGPGAPITYTATPLAPIPDNSQNGLMSTLVVPDDREILDLDFRIDSMTHTWVGDMSIMLRGPSGFGADLIYLPGSCAGTSCSLGTNDGDNFVNTRIDDEAPADLLLLGGALAPFTASYIPVFNSPAWATPDPVDQLARFDGSSSQGNWRLFAVDNGAADLGVLNSWSVIVTPQEYTCCTVCCTAVGQEDDDFDGARVCEGDCDDQDPDVYPGATQVCGDGLNNDCNDPGWPGLAGTNEVDNDGDSITGCGGDCDDADPTAWATPAESADLSATHDKISGVTTFVWGASPVPGGVGLRSDVLRSDSPSDFVSTLVTSCLESDDTLDRIAQDPAPPLFSIVYYLQRWENNCPGGGVAGRSSAGAVKPALDCP